MLSCHLYTFILTLYQLVSPPQHLLCISLILIFLSVINQLLLCEGCLLNVFFRLSFSIHFVPGLTHVSKKVFLVFYSCFPKFTNFTSHTNKFIFFHIAIQIYIKLFFPIFLLLLDLFLLTFLF